MWEVKVRDVVTQEEPGACCGLFEPQTFVRFQWAFGGILELAVLSVGCDG